MTLIVRESVERGTVKGFGDPDFIERPATVEDIRQAVESGTIKGEVRRYCEKHEALVGAIPHLCNVANWVIDGGGSPTDCRINDALVVSDGGEDR